MTDGSRPGMPRGRRPGLHIGEIARRVGVTPRTVRFYEDLGLLDSARRSKGGFRLYDEGQVDRLRAVLALKEVGFTLEEIRAYQEVAREGETALDVVANLRRRLDAGRRRLRERLRRLEEAMVDLERADRVLAGCSGCEGKSYDAACHDCWAEMAGGSCPWALRALLPGAWAGGGGLEGSPPDGGGEEGS